VLHDADCGGTPALCHLDALCIEWLLGCRAAGLEQDKSDAPSEIDSSPPLFGQQAAVGGDRFLPAARGVTTRLAGWGVAGGQRWT
jgi:hypothetical protein